MLQLRSWRLSAALACVSLMLWAEPAFADRSKVAAEALFDEGRRLVSEGKLGEACPKFLASQKLDPAPGTLLNLADCYEKNGQTASAWATFREAAALARTENRADFEQTATKRASGLSSKLSRMTIKGLSDGTPSDAIVVTCDGTQLLPAEWDVPIPVDPGLRTIEVKAAGKKTWTKTVEVGAAGDVVTVTVPPLEQEQPLVSPPAEPPRSVTEPVVPRALAPTGAEPEAPNTLRTVGYALGAVGIVGLGAAGYFALRANGYNRDSDAFCINNVCKLQGKQLRDDARSFGNFATVGVVAGSALLAGGVGLLVFGPSTKSGGEKPSASVRVTGTGFMVEGAW